MIRTSQLVIQVRIRGGGTSGIVYDFPIDWKWCLKEREWSGLENELKWRGQNAKSRKQKTMTAPVRIFLNGTCCRVLGWLVLISPWHNLLSPRKRFLMRNHLDQSSLCLCLRLSWLLIDIGGHRRSWVAPLPRQSVLNNLIEEKAGRE